MDKYRIRNLSLNSKFPSTNVHLSSTGPMYTIGGTTHQHQQHLLGPQLLMNTPSVGTSTQFQFVPEARNFCTTSSGTQTPSKTIPLAIGVSVVPLIHQVKRFFVNLVKSKVDADTKNTAMYDTTRRAYSSTPNIYMDIMDSKCDDDLDKKSFVDLSNCEMLSKLSASTKSFSDYDLPVTTTSKNNFIPKSQEISRKMEQDNCTEQPAATPTKEDDNLPSEAPDLIKRRPSSPILLQQKSKKNRKRKKTPNVSAKPRRQCNDALKGNRTTIGVSACKKTTKIGKNQKEKQKHELAQTIHEDIEADIETMSTDHWDEPIVFVSTFKQNQIDRLDTANPKLISFSTDDFPEMPTTRNDPMIKRPTPSQCSLKSFTKEKQREISECDSEDSFIVFDYDNASFDNKSIPSSTESTTPPISEFFRRRFTGQRWQLQRQISECSDDDFICFEMEGSDMDVDYSDDEDSDETASESDSESEVDDSISSLAVKKTSKRKVRFNPKVEVHYLHVWSFAANQTRISGFWECYGRDCLRFRDRVERLEPTLLPIITPAHREKIYNQRFKDMYADNVN